MKTPSSLLLAATLLYAPLALTQTDYSYHTFTYPGADFTQVFGINDRGQVAGTAAAGADNFPFVYDIKKGTFTNITPLAGYASTSVFDVSDSGTVVGAVLSEDGTTFSGVIIDKHGNATVFEHPDALSQTLPRGVNNRGQVVGIRDSVNDVFQTENGFIYDSRTGEFTDIVPSVFTIAHGINNRGEVAGHAFFFESDSPCPLDPGELKRFGWKRDKQGNVTYFTVNDSGTAARGISDSGTIAGFITTGTGIKAFTVELDGTQCQDITIADADLISVPTATLTLAEGLNSKGIVSGDWSVANDIFGFVAIPH
jgi:uncharacterized membrane protein